MKNKKATATNGTAITSLADLRAAVDALMTCQFKLDGREVALKVRRINFQVDERRREILRKPMPPWVKERNGYDQMAPEYRAALDLAEDQARSFVVYHCCPEVADGNKGLTDVAAIHAYVKDLLPATILETISLTALIGGFERDVEEVDARANFTSTPGSES